MDAKISYTRAHDNMVLSIQYNGKSTLNIKTLLLNWCSWGT